MTDLGTFIRQTIDDRLTALRRAENDQSATLVVETQEGEGQVVEIRDDNTAVVQLAGGGTVVGYIGPSQPRVGDPATVSGGRIFV